VGGLVSSYLLQLTAVAPRLRGTARDTVEEPAIGLTRALLTWSAGAGSAADTLETSLQTRLLEYLRQNFVDR
jgi:hypothetical protein